MERTDIFATDSDSENDAEYIIVCDSEELACLEIGLDEMRLMYLSHGYDPSLNKALVRASRLLDQIQNPVEVRVGDKTADEIRQRLHPDVYKPGYLERMDARDPFNLNNSVTAHIVGLDTTYDVSNRGDVYYNGNRIKTKEEKNGRKYFVTNSGGRRQKVYIDEVILNAFVGVPNRSDIKEMIKPEYINGDIRNCVLPNLRWTK